MRGRACVLLAPSRDGAGGPGASLWPEGCCGPSLAPARPLRGPLAVGGAALVALVLPVRLVTGSRRCGLTGAGPLPTPLLSPPTLGRGTGSS